MQSDTSFAAESQFDVQGEGAIHDQLQGSIEAMSIEDSVPPGSLRRASPLFMELLPLSPVPKFHKTYFVSTFGLDWFDALEFCRGHNLQLLSIESSTEQIYLRTHLTPLLVGGPGDYTWYTSGTDLGQEGRFRWTSSGKPLSFSNWLSGQPDNGGTGQHCLVLSGIGPIGWADEACNRGFGFICERSELN